ncbi:RNA-binding motif, single-stranded-interacting protein 1-like isoform X1 [Hydractinia symbiolongicarpus]|uniref:RNA-binding motif, single-stranded-interacting protein 1-like isoform X1 n=1 Tax=Hydractinia symbiolongicarpus TaxID=13093 RepID=UPI00254D9554|nr:RNA-binding motif, single-stranded-interacting protein 1-like isoform X1 [Hydractinia symbiolongicarpus]
MVQTSLNETRYPVETIKGQAEPDASSPSDKNMINGSIIDLKKPAKTRGETEYWRHSPELDTNENMNKLNNDKDEINDAKNDKIERKSPVPQQKRGSTPVSTEKTKQTADKRQTRSNQNTSSYGRSFRPGLVPTPNVAYPWPNHINWQNYYLASQQRHASPVVYGYQPAYYQYASTVNSHHSTNSSPTSNHMYANSYTDTQDGEKLSKTNLYIRGLHSSTTDEDLVNMCRIYGNIISTKAILHKDTNQCKGYGFVDFDSPVAAQRAVSALQNKGIQAQMAKQQEQDPTNLYLSNLPKQIDEQQLQHLLASYGNVISTRILRDTSGSSKCVGFARLESTEICEQVIDKLNGQYLSGSNEQLLVKFADGGPKKTKQDKTWRNPSEDYMNYGVRSPVSRTMSNPPTARVTPVIQSPMGHGAGTNIAAYHMPVTGVSWGVQPQSYTVPVSPHQLPTDTIQSMHSPMSQMNNQMAQMHIHGGTNQYIMPAPGGYSQQNSWQMTQTLPQESPVIMTATEVESNYPPPHMHHHGNEPIYSDDQQTRVVYAYQRK